MKNNVFERFSPENLKLLEIICIFVEILSIAPLGKSVMR